MRPLLATILGAALLLHAGAALAQGNGGTQPRVNPDAQLQAVFLKRVEAYMELREGALKRLPPEVTASGVPQAERLARVIVQARPAAEPGEFFTSAVRAYVRRQIARVLAGPDGAQIRASIMDENPGRIHVRINGRYPDSAPLASMPLQVLAALPKLPTELEFRFIGRRLILLDVDAHLVLDYMENALQR